MSTDIHPPGLDVVTFGEVMAMFVADTPGPLDRVGTYHRALAGSEANVAVGLARLGHRVGWVGRVGDDPFGWYAIAELTGAGVDTTMVTVDEEAPTGFQIKSKVVGGDPEVVYFRRNSAGSRLAPAPDADAYVAAARHLHVTGIPLALSPSARAFALRAIEVARAAGATISFDPNLRPSLWPSQQEMVRVINEVAVLADWVLPGTEEGRILVGDADPEGIAAYYLRQGVSQVVVKNGGHGASLHTRAGSWTQPAFPVSVVDTVGAGDGFAAGLISAYLDGLDESTALRRAAAVGALATTSLGDKDGLPTLEELGQFLDSRHSPACSAN